MLIRTPICFLKTKQAVNSISIMAEVLDATQVIKHLQTISAELNIAPKYVNAVVELLEGGATIPFIARYRKEVTGSMDEVNIAAIRDRLEELRELDARRATILKSIEEQGKLTEELKEKILEAETLSKLEDIYLPYKPKRRTRATIAREKGLEPLALKILAQENFDVNEEAAKYIVLSEEKDKTVANAQEAIAGAQDIIAEIISEDAIAREKIRQLFLKEAVCTCKVIPGKEQEGQKYRDYFDWEEPITQMPSHRLLAVRRAEREGILSLNIAPNEEEALQLLESQFVTARNSAGELVADAVKDGYKRLMKPSIETEVRLITKKKADEEAIRIFSENLRQLLLTSPLGQKRVLALDPGFRTGCKVVCLNEQGDLLDSGTIYPNEPQRKVAEAAEILKTFCNKYDIEAIAIGNGTASRETEQFVRSINLDKKIQIVVVNEAGASVYSASDVARKEFPDLDLTVRGTISIGRRLMDPLAELVKIEPKSIGVGQYQHDVDQYALKKSLDDVTISAVNKVGVELNTASRELLAYVSGLGPSLADNIVKYREKHGAFKTRKQLLEVARLDEKAFEQCAGFLRIRGGENPLDASAVHPERYELVEQMAQDLGCTVKDLMSSAELRAKLDLNKYVNDEVGLPTLKDILDELAKPGRDPREQFEMFSFAEGINTINDLRVGMKLPGIVTNITAFGVFVDIGVHQDGLIHVSNLSDRFVKDASEVVKLQQKVMVTVTEVDIPRKRIALSMRTDAAPAGGNAANKEGKRERKPVLDKNERPKPHDAQKSYKKTQKQEEESSFAYKLAMLKQKFGK